MDVSEDLPARAGSLGGSSIAAAEAALIERARRGDHDAFAALVDGRLAATLRTATAILGNDADARDATQEIFIRTWRNLPGLRDVRTFPGWFGRIVVNTCRTSIRGRRRRLVREIAVSRLTDDPESLVPASTRGEERIDHAELIERALDRLSPGERTILWLHHHEGLALTEIGDLLGIPSRTVKSRLFTARRSLKRALEEETR
jgi:RNA polymerase sigma-70 factor (ECF subfamily)